MAGILTPSLRPLDERVLAELRPDRGRRAITVAKVLHGAPGYRCEDCGHVTRVGGISERKRAGWEQRNAMRCPEWADGCGGRERPVLLVTDEQAREARQVLRGLECVGRAYQAGGWWRRTSR